MWSIVCVGPLWNKGRVCKAHCFPIEIALAATKWSIFFYSHMKTTLLLLYKIHVKAIYTFSRFAPCFASLASSSSCLAFFCWILSSFLARYSLMLSISVFLRSKESWSSFPTHSKKNVLIIKKMFSFRNYTFQSTGILNYNRIIINDLIKMS